MSNVFPCLSANNPPDCRKGESVCKRNGWGVFRIFGHELAYFKDLRLGKFCFAVLCSALQIFGMCSSAAPVTARSNSKHYFRVRLSAGRKFWIFSHRMLVAKFMAKFNDFILSIGFVCPNKNVVWVNAVGVIALMASQKPRRYWSNTQFVADSARLFIFSVVKKYGISVISACAGPLPAFSNFRNVALNFSFYVHLAPKSLNIFFGHKNKTPAKPEVDSAQQRRQQEWRALNFRSLFLMASPMPKGLCHV